MSMYMSLTFLPFYFSAVTTRMRFGGPEQRVGVHAAERCASFERDLLCMEPYTMTVVSGRCVGERHGAVRDQRHGVQRGRIAAIH